MMVSRFWPFSKKQRLFLHIGLHKTGTTSLQHFLLSNAGHFSELGYLYPISPVWPGSAAHHRLSWKLAGLQQARELDFDEIRKTLAEELSVYRGNVILSSEDFSRLRLPAIRTLSEMFRGFSVSVVVYLRRQDDRIESYYKQNVVSGVLDVSFEEYLESVRAANDYRAFLEPWRKVFPGRRPIVRIYEEMREESIFADFLDILGIPSAEGFVQSGDLNLSPDQRVAESLRVLNKAWAEGKIRCSLEEFKTTIKKPVRKILEAQEDGLRYSYLDADERMGLMRYYEASNTALAREFFGRPVLFPERNVPMQTTRFDAAHLKYTDLLDLIGWKPST